MTNPHVENRQQERGFALILAMLTLVLLTTLGLSLTTSTSSELQIATNHRWSEQARYNAEAGVEVAKRVLAQVADWNSILPDARNPASTWNPNLTTVSYTGPGITAKFTAADPYGLPSRNFEGYRCDSLGNGTGYGAVLHTGSGTPYQFVSNVEGFLLTGAFTLWIRRPTEMVLGSPTARDYVGNDALILTSEGVAPFGGATMNATSLRQAARQVIEVVLRRSGGGSTGTTTTDCGARQGQVGGGAQNTGFGGCVALTGGDDLKAALPAGATDVGTGNVK